MSARRAKDTPNQTNLDAPDIAHLFEQLRAGLVPRRGLEALAVGVDRERAELHRQLDLVASGEGGFKLIRGGYGCGKTFMTRLLLQDAAHRGFATSFVVASDRDLPLYDLRAVYAGVVEAMCDRRGRRSNLAGFVRQCVEHAESVLTAGEEDRSIAGLVGDELARRGAPHDMVRAVRTLVELQQSGDAMGASQLLAWLSGSRHVGSTRGGARRAAAIKGDLDKSRALDFLRGVVELAKMAGNRGVVIVIDEVETITRMRGDLRPSALSALRQIIDAANDCPGLLWVLTGTPEFFDDRRGVAGLPPLHDRLQLQREGGHVGLRQPQLVLSPFDAERLRQIATRLIELYPTDERKRLRARITPAYVNALIDHVCDGLARDVGVVPRGFLRRFVHVLDAVQDDPSFNPTAALRPPDKPDHDEPSQKNHRNGVAKPAANELTLVGEVW